MVLGMLTSHGSRRLRAGYEDMESDQDREC